ncbi:hypothetical protein SAMN00808754_0845 [Thermanaeromonas toyohensis ToBE]|uniref:FAD:protein FMN transferase n=1 Tax=Thermanaeromonas toyohensis ToBE TaxID=698762 RepID=A0A1W1VJG0_9FIRM|nr:UPF0280 family protein [Thermanaeromonas toyohensis]SMB93370.1 hypothetical protein SAMN00808754_0845 [Thermanaeromonas toyohensis ToBE]
MWRHIDTYRCFIDCGPVQMSVLAERQGRPLSPNLWDEVEGRIKRCLASLKHYLPEARKPWPKAQPQRKWPKILQIMFEAVRATGDPTLTSMAAVAGSFAWVVREFLVEEGATKVLINNGGDIALYLAQGESTRVGIVPRLGLKPTHYIEVKDSDGIGGIATSGFGGRSFTLGIADAAVAIASTAPLADALATILGNAVNAEHPEIKRKPARELDPASDLGSLPVTTWVGNLPLSIVEEALEKGYQKAIELYHKSLLKGAVLILKGIVRQLPEGVAHRINENSILA